MRYGKYTLDLYCDNRARRYSSGDIHNNKDWPVQYVSELGSTARAVARRDGWLLGKNKTLCPLCSGKREV